MAQRKKLGIYIISNKRNNTLISMKSKSESSIITRVLKCIKNAQTLLPVLSTPIYHQLPFFLLFFITIGYFPNVKSFDINDTYISLFGNLCISIIFAYILCTIINAITSKQIKQIVKITFYILTLSLFATGYFLFSNFRMTISPMCFVLLAETSGKESSEFINQYILSSTIIPTLKIIFKYLLIAIILEYVWQYIRKKIEKIRILCCNTISILIIPIFLFGTYHSRVYIKAYNTNSADEIRLMRFPKDHFSSIYKSALILNMMGQNMEDALIVNKKFYHNHNSRTTINDSINIVVVIGESHIKYHSQIYNYSLKTMPRLSKEHEIGRLHIFDDVITSSNSTSVIMKNILCCNNSSDQEGWYNYPTFTSIFKKAGYKVYLWDNQRDFDKTATYSFTLNSFLYNPELEGINYTKTNKESYTYDEDIVESFKKQVDYSKDKHNLVLFHLTGQHHDVRGRFPKSFNLFNADSIKRNEPFLGQEEKSYIADYDNATIYNDYVIYKIIETFRDSNTIIIYFSDHGEEVYDYRAQCGRDQGVMTANKLKYQYDVPFVIWCSEKFEANYPQKVASIKNSVNKPFILDNICHLLYNVAGVSTPVYRDSLDLISTNYKCKDRIINNTYNYEKIRFQ